MQRIQDKQIDMPLELFKMKDYGIPYSYSPVITCSKRIVKSKQEALKSFLQATKKGFEYAQQHSEKAAEILKPLVPEKDKNMDLKQSIEVTCSVLGVSDHWGKMNPDGIGEFLSWLQDQKLENHNLKAASLFTNNLL